MNLNEQQKRTLLNKDRKERIISPFEKVLSQIKMHTQLILTFFGVSMGILLGFTLRSANLSSETIMLISFPGDLLMRMLKMLVLPLVVSSLITGVAVLDPKSSGKIGLYAISYYLLSTILAATLGKKNRKNFFPVTFNENFFFKRYNTCCHNKTG